MINSDRYYTPRDIVLLAQKGFFPIKSRATLGKHIDSGRMKAVNYGTQDRPFWKIKGSELVRFMEFGDVGSLPSYEERKAIRIQEQGTDSSE